MDIDVVSVVCIGIIIHNSTWPKKLHSWLTYTLFFGLRSSYQFLSAKLVVLIAGRPCLDGEALLVRGDLLSGG